jgi:hypothetical protein
LRCKGPLGLGATDIMQAGHSDASILSVPPEPFALIIGGAIREGTPSAVEAGLRRMGLRPESVADGTGGDTWADGPLFRLRFGSASLLAGQASAAALDLADPLHPSTSLLASSLPREWCAPGHCWAFVPEGGDRSAADPVQMREFFKTMVLLIDLFDASHFFWSPARLWSDAPQFRASIAEMLKSGMPPVLHLVAFRHHDTGEGAAVRTRGLAHFGGQELEGRIPSGWTVAEMVKRLARLALDIIINGPVAEPRRVRGLDAGEWVSLAPRGTEAPPTVLVEFDSDFG